MGSIPIARAVRNGASNGIVNSASSWVVRLRTTQAVVTAQLSLQEAGGVLRVSTPTQALFMGLAASIMHGHASSEVVRCVAKALFVEVDNHGINEPRPDTELKEHDCVVQ